jgi:DNA-binding NtrC family response regulator
MPEVDLPVNLPVPAPAVNDTLTGANILVIDDEAAIRESLEVLLTLEGYSVRMAGEGEQGLRILELENFDLVLLDLALPGQTGLELLPQIKERQPELPVIMITAYGTVDNVVEAVRAGAENFVQKPWDNEKLLADIRSAVARHKAEEENLQLKRTLKQRYNFVNIVGKSEIMLRVFDLVAQVAPSRSTVLIQGESGTGKELIAKAIHSHSGRRDKPFIPVNTGAVPADLLESTLFGHERGAFTSAHAAKKGLFEVASGGTLFLDEIGTMSMDMQAKILRVLQDRRFMHVGGTHEIQVDVRIVAATNVDLRVAVKEGRFREDLFYRLNVIHLVVPPLRERREDIPALIDHFLRKYSTGNGNGNGNGNTNGHQYIVGEIAPEAVAVLREYAWPGNVRELENVIERLVVTGRREVIHVEDLGTDIRTPAQIGTRPRRERRRTVADDLFKKLIDERESFWTSVYPLYMNREITRSQVRDVVHKGLEEARGNYKIVLRLFNMELGDYKRFLNFLRKHDCQLPFKEYRQ